MSHWTNVTENGVKLTFDEAYLTIDWVTRVVKGSESVEYYLGEK